MSSIEYPEPVGLLKHAAFSQVVVGSGSRLVFTSGQVALDEQGNLVGGNDLGEQTAQAMRNLVSALAASGATYADVVKTTTYVVNYRPEHRSVIGKAKAPFNVGREPPASALVGVAALAAPEWLIEIEAIAIVG